MSYLYNIAWCYQSGRFMLDMHSSRYKQKLEIRFVSVIQCSIFIIFICFCSFTISFILISLVPVPKICPKGWKSRKESCYKVFYKKVNWFQAQVMTGQFINDIKGVLIIFYVFICFIHGWFSDSTLSSQMNCRKFDSTLVQIEDELENHWLKKQYPNIKMGKSTLYIKFQLVLKDKDFL